MAISKALANLAFGAWNEFEPGNISDGSTAMTTQPEASPGFKHHNKKLG